MKATEHQDDKLGKMFSGKIVIQGGAGSFNHSAVRKWLAGMPQSNLTVEFAQSTEEVLRRVEEGDCQYGQFALHNSVGGFYDESIEAIGDYRFTTMTKHQYPVEHALLAHPSCPGRDISEIVTHAEVLKHCCRHVEQLLQHVTVRVGKGDYHDPASVARDVANGVLPPYVGTISNPALAMEWGLTIAHPAMHDHESVSTFLVVTGREENAKTVQA